jgi:hypothetical protein
MNSFDRSNIKKIESTEEVLKLVGGAELKSVV